MAIPSLRDVLADGGLLVEGLCQRLWMVHTYFELDNPQLELIHKFYIYYIAVPDLVTYVFKATNLGKQDLRVPQLLRKRYKRNEVISCLLFIFHRMIIRKLTKHDAEDYKQIRLEALYNNPDSFGTMYHEEAIKTIDQFRDRITVDNNNFMLGCFEDKELIGIVAFHQQSRTKVRHKAYIRSMYVQQEYQGKGIGKLLLNELIERAKAINEIEILLLNVVTSNLSAKQIYFSLGFQIYAIEKMAYKFNNQYFDMESMCLGIK